MTETAKLNTASTPPMAAQANHCPDDIIRSALSQSDSSTLGAMGPSVALSTTVEITSHAAAMASRTKENRSSAGRLRLSPCSEVSKVGVSPAAMAREASINPAPRIGPSSRKPETAAAMK